MKNLFRNISPFNGRDQMPLWQYIIKILLAFLLCRWGGMLLGELLVVPLLLTQGISLSNPQALSPSTWLLLNFYGSIFFIVLTLLYWKKSIYSL